MKLRRVPLPLLLPQATPSRGRTTTPSRMRLRLPRPTPTTDSTKCSVTAETARVGSAVAVATVADTAAAEVAVTEEAAAVAVVVTAVTAVDVAACPRAPARPPLLRTRRRSLVSRGAALWGLHISPSISSGICYRGAIGAAIMALTAIMRYTRVLRKLGPRCGRGCNGCTIGRASNRLRERESAHP